LIAAGKRERGKKSRRRKSSFSADYGGAKRHGWALSEKSEGTATAMSHIEAAAS